MQLFAANANIIIEVLHGVFDFVLLISLIMGGLFTFFVSTQNWKHITTAGNIAASSYLLTFIMGLLMYPVFRVDVRAALLDPNLPQATGLFEIKENLAALGAFVAIALLILGLFGKMRQANRNRKMLYGGLAASLGFLSIMIIVLGFTFTSFY